MPPTVPASLKSEYTISSESSKFNIPVNSHIDNVFQNMEPTFRDCAVGALTFDSQGRVLLVQRASTDSMPNRWEVPGGGCDHDDESIIWSVVRELWEEAGLKAVRIGSPVGDGYTFMTRSRNLVCKYHFIVEVENGTELPRDGNGWIKAQLDPAEHQAYVWASPEEVAAGQVKDVVLHFTRSEQRNIVQEAFTVRSQQRESQAIPEKAST